MKSTTNNLVYYTTCLLTKSHKLNSPILHPRLVYVIFCSKEKKVEELTIVEIVDFDKFMFVYEQEYIGTILSCRYCRFKNKKPKNLLKVLYSLYLYLVLACCFYNFSKYMLAIGPAALSFCYLIGIFEYFQMKNGDAIFSKSVLPILVGNKLLIKRCTRKGC